MPTSLSIADLCRRTSLTSRALRFYDARGLVPAQRSAAGQRRYGPAEIARLHQVTALKQAGFTLAQIERLLGPRPLDLARLIDAQLESLAVERDRVDEAVASLTAARARLAAGRALDIDTFCTLIKQGERAMTEADAWKKVADRYYSPDEQARWAEKQAAMPADFDQAAYSAKWADLGERIEAALPMDPKSDKAQAFLAEWKALLAPFTRVATPEMMAGATKLYDKMPEWQGDVTAPFSMKVWEFIKSAGPAPTLKG